MIQTVKWIIVFAMVASIADLNLTRPLGGSKPNNNLGKQIKSYLAIVDLDPSVFDYNPDDHKNDDKSEDSHLSGIKFISYLNSLPDDHEIAWNDHSLEIINNIQGGKVHGFFIPHRPVAWWWDDAHHFHIRFAMRPLRVTKIHASPYVVEVPAYNHTSGRRSHLR